MDFELVISDFDGTLGIRPGIIEQETVEAIKEYEKKGGIFVVCSGRTASTIIPICKRYGLSGLVVSNQGARISDIETDTPLLLGGLDNKTASKIAKDLLNENIDVCGCVDNIIVGDHPCEYIDYHKGLINKALIVKDLVKYFKKTKRHIYKIVATTTPEKVIEIVFKYQKKYDSGLTVNSGGDRLIEVINSHYNKGNAVKFLAKHYNIPYERIMTVGDSTNDLELVSGKWFGVAVGDGKAELKKVAKEITVPYSEQPIKVLLKKYCL